MDFIENVNAFRLWHRTINVWVTYHTRGWKSSGFDLDVIDVSLGLFTPLFEQAN